VFTTGVFEYDIDVKNNEYVFDPIVKIINKFTVKQNKVIHQDLKIIRNDVGTTSFFTFEKKFPFYSLAPDTSTPY